MDGPTVLVAGAGPTGLALACGLRAAGTSVRVVDAAKEPARTSRALGLQPRGSEVLDRLGALEDLPRSSIPIRQVIAHVDGRPVARLKLGRPTKLVTRPGLLISQAEVEARLRNRLSQLGVEVEWGRELTSAEQDADGVTATLNGDVTSGTTGEIADGNTGEPIRADWLVGCDGAHSRVRRAAGIGFPGVPVVERFLLADVRAQLPFPRDAASVWLRGEQMCGVFPLPGDTWRVMAPAAAGTGADLGPEELLGVLAGALREMAGLESVPVRETLWTSTFRIHRRLASTYRQGRMLLAGDAAHIHSPLGGQGLNTGLGDAENLAWKLALVASGRAGDGLLETYEAERRPVAREVVESTSALTRVVTGQNAPARALRDHVLVPLLNRPLVQRLVWEEASQLKIGYRGGPLARRSPRTWTTRGPHPGDRVPDLECTTGDGRGTRLHAELGSRWALLLPRGAEGGCAELARRRLGGAERVSVLTPAGRSPGGASAPHALLVRPDAHLAWRGTSPDALAAWLTSALVGGHVR
ncbi:FAD-dependent monooxygenase [Streptomyces winkii]|uniref:FAD-dependent monooxygenase n=1 Tax=Streptomyces winkii TaxID=3051178 RepID=UPI0028D51E6F|nr:FAD-dependent monooxygenase [Streptomyces sp. DSM 40971]